MTTLATHSDATLSMRVFVYHYRQGQLLEARDEGTGNLVVGFINTLISDAVTGSSVVPTMTRYKFLASGTSNTAEADTQTALGAEVATRATCVLTNAQTANGTNHAGILQFVGSINYTGSFTVAEVGLFDSGTSSAGNMADRKVVGPYSLVNGDALQITWQLTLPSGG